MLCRLIPCTFTPRRIGDSPQSRSQQMRLVRAVEAKPRLRGPGSEHACNASCATLQSSRQAPAPTRRKRSFREAVCAAIKSAARPRFCCFGRKASPLRPRHFVSRPPPPISSVEELRHTAGTQRQCLWYYEGSIAASRSASRPSVLRRLRDPLSQGCKDTSHRNATTDRSETM